ncbi:MAG: hypothetical protein AB7D38_12070 [Sulfurimonas sp.]|uniref:hypothetical protein n=1 Tax=Sulfurimonas sp. TaxID=2022749 RepID=UPI003D0D4701
MKQLIILTCIVSSLVIHSCLLLTDILARRQNTIVILERMSEIENKAIEFRSEILDEIEKNKAVIFILK